MRLYPVFTQYRPGIGPAPHEVRSGDPKENSLKPFVPADFQVPTRLDHEQFFLRPLMIGDVVKDYDAVMTSIPRLQNLFGPSSSWPCPELTFEQDLIDLGWHHKEFQRRSSFTYTVLAPDGGLCLGCVYLYPTSIEGYDSEAYCWVRSSHATLDAVLVDTVRSWLARDWPFRRTALPGRDFAWPAAVPDP
jgi:hypothetical protein